MRIAINTMALLDDKAGAERYTENIIDALTARDPRNEYLLFLSRLNQHIYGVDRPNVKKIVLNVPARNRVARILWEQLMLPAHLKRAKADLVFSPCNVAPAFPGCPSVVMIFDMHWFVFPELFGRRRRLYITKMIAHSAHKAHAILTLSESSKRDIVRFLHVDPAKITVTHCGYTHRGMDPSDGLAAGRPVEGPYILAVGQLHKRKNVPRLLAAFAELKRERGIPHRLVLVGRPGDGMEDIEAALGRLGVRDSVVQAGYVGDGELPSYYRHADALAYVSLYEGFGIPPLEAMAAGVPVVASNVSSVPEVVGEGGILVNPRNIPEITQALWTLLSNQDLRASLVAAGQAQVQRFSWDRAADATIEVFNRLVARQDETGGRRP